MEVLTKDGFKPFTGVRKTFTNTLVQLSFENGVKIKCTPEHNIVRCMNDKDMTGIMTPACKFKRGDFVIGLKDGNSIRLRVTEIESIKVDPKTAVYDLLNVGEKHEFVANGIALSNCLILDEFAFVPPNEANEFFASVYPVISSGKNSKVIIVSTPNGAQGLYYDIWTQANLNTMDPEKNAEGWKPIRIDWFEVPGRDEKWKKQQIASVGIEKWEQEFECQFTSSSFQKLIPSELTDRYRKSFNKLIEDGQ